MTFVLVLWALCFIVAVSPVERRCRARNPDGLRCDLRRGHVYVPHEGLHWRECGMYEITWEDQPPNWPLPVFLELEGSWHGA